MTIDKIFIFTLMCLLQIMGTTPLEAKALCKGCGLGGIALAGTSFSPATGPRYNYYYAPYRYGYAPYYYDYYTPVYFSPSYYYWY